MYLPTRFEPGIARNTKVIADLIHCFPKVVFNMDIEPSSRLSCLRHQITSDWRVFECVDAKPAT